MHKHGISGIAPKSPSLRLALKMAAEKGKPKNPEPEMVDSIKELFR